MAYPCKIWLKSECDGCGRCEDEDERPMAYGRPYNHYWEDDQVNDPMDKCKEDWCDGGDPEDIQRD